MGQRERDLRKDPPNAAVSVLGKDGSVRDAVIVMKTPKLEGDQLTFDVDALEGNLNGGDGPASVFIDRFAFGGGGRGGFAVGGVGRVGVVGVDPDAWYRGATAGAWQVQQQWVARWVAPTTHLLRLLPVPPAIKGGQSYRC